MIAGSRDHSRGAACLDAVAAGLRAVDDQVLGAHNGRVCRQAPRPAAPACVPVRGHGAQMVLYNKSHEVLPGIMIVDKPLASLAMLRQVMSLTRPDQLFAPLDFDSGGKHAQKDKQVLTSS